jgi:dCMP deaminase
MIQPIDPQRKVAVLESFTHLPTEHELQIVMPDEDVSRALAKEHLGGYDVSFSPTFLRWDKQITTTEFEVPSHRIISAQARDKRLMEIANAEASYSTDWWRQVGAVIVQDGVVVANGHNRPLVAEDYTINTFGDPRSNFDAGQSIELQKMIHGEAGLIAVAARDGVPLKGASIYVTTFPCPNCAKLIALSGIKHVYYEKGYSLLDAEDVFATYGVELVLVK